jgi:hypothetical protein
MEVEIYARNLAKNQTAWTPKTSMEETIEWAWNKQNDIKINLRETRCQDVDWIQLANHRICEYCAEHRGFYKTSENVLLGWLSNF